MNTEPANGATPGHYTGLAAQTRPGVDFAVPQIPDFAPGREGDFEVFRETFLCCISEPALNRAVRALGRLFYDSRINSGENWRELPGALSYWEVLAALGDLRHLEHHLRSVGRGPWDNMLGPEEVMFCVGVAAEAHAAAKIAGRLERLLQQYESLSREKPKPAEELEPAELSTFSPGPDMGKIAWDIRSKGRAWRGEEARLRHALLPEKLEIIQGRLLWDDDERRLVLGLLLENLGADEAVRLGPPEVWRAAVARLPAEAA